MNKGSITCCGAGHHPPVGEGGGWGMKGRGDDQMKKTKEKMTSACVAIEAKAHTNKHTHTQTRKKKKTHKHKNTQKHTHKLTHTPALTTLFSSITAVLLTKAAAANLNRSEICGEGEGWSARAKARRLAKT